VAIQDEIPKSRLTLTYRTTISGAMQEVTLPFRILVLADFSLGTGVDRQVDLSDRELRPLSGRNLNPIMKDMKMSLRCTVPNKIDPDSEETLDVDLTVDSMKSFSPDKVAQSVPKIRALLVMKQLLLETQAMIDNRKDVRKLVQEIYTRPELSDALLNKLPEFKNIRLPESKAATTT
jgi:type VI secretion system protein ImpB